MNNITKKYIALNTNYELFNKLFKIFEPKINEVTKEIGVSIYVKYSGLKENKDMILEITSDSNFTFYKKNQLNDRIPILYIPYSDIYDDKIYEYEMYRLISGDDDGLERFLIFIIYTFEPYMTYFKIDTICKTNP